MIHFNNTVSSIAQLPSLGFTLTHHEAEWEDIGGPESGPSLCGHDEFDEWTLDNHFVIVVDGEIVEQGEFQPDPFGPF